MEDCIEVILQDRTSRWSHSHCSQNLTLMIGSAFAGVYGLWAMFCTPGLRVPFRLKTDLSKYRNVTVFLALAVMEVLEEKLLKELPEDARVIVCHFPFPRWTHSCTAGSGLNQVWAYDVHTASTPPYQSQA